MKTLWLVPLLAASPLLAYDASGNLTNDGVWSYRWDSDNRLLEMSMVANISNLPSAQRKKLKFAYDNQGRRIRKTVSCWVPGNWAEIGEYLFLYDGWNLIATLSSSRAPLTTFVWGLDLSGSQDGAGGVGGLLLERQFVGPQGSGCQFPCYDGNGNVVALVASDGSLSARYEYAGFGEVLRCTGLLADSNPLRWSTKYCDAESGLSYYGARFYSPALGRWLNADPTGEQGGLNLHGFCANAPINCIDTLGCSAYLTVRDLYRVKNLVKLFSDCFAIKANPTAVVGGTKLASSLATGGANAFIKAAAAMLDASLTILSGAPLAMPGTIERNASDFILDSLAGDNSYADLDAATMAAQAASPSGAQGGSVLWSVLGRSYATSDAVVAWEGIEMLGDYLQR